MVELKGMSTESTNPDSANLDTFSALEIVTLMNKEDKKIPLAIEEHLSEIAEAVMFCTESLRNGGRIIYLGAGTSGRIGVLDASECPPTFGVSFNTVVGLIAGGESAFIKAVEGAEDNLKLAEDELKNLNLTKTDTVIGIAASGRTPYVIGGLKYAMYVGCKTVSITCNKHSKMSEIVTLPIEITVGPEVLTGSTRLKAGTAQKLVLNMISTASMIKIGKCYKNYMVDMVQSNDKLKVRAQNIIMDITGLSREEAESTLIQANGSVKLALVMILASCSAKEATERLNKANGFVRDAIK